MSEWQYEGQEFTEVPEEFAVEGAGIVYLITNLTNERKYIGKKILFSKVKRPPLKGKKRARRILKESDWRKYWGSSDWLQSDVKEFGADKFKREILHLCRSKAEMGYLEIREIFVRDAILSYDYYNTWMSYKINQNSMPKLVEDFNRRNTED